MKAIEVPGTGFIIFGGCQNVYNSIQTYLGTGDSDVWVNAQIYSISRSRLGIGKNVRISGYQTNGPSFHYTCDHLVMAIPPVVNDLISFFDLSIREYELFQNIKTRYYYDGYINVSGPLSSGGFTIRNVNASGVFNQPISPATIDLFRSFPFGPAGLLGYSDDPMSTTAFTAVVNSELSNIPSSLLTVSVPANVNRHVYQPYPKVSSINHSPGYFTRLKNLQGWLHTYWVGAGSSYSGSYIVCENAHDVFTQAGFVNKTS
jgi:hypothetical protein